MEAADQPPKLAAKNGNTTVTLAAGTFVGQKDKKDHDLSKSGNPDISGPHARSDLTTGILLVRSGTGCSAPAGAACPTQVRLGLVGPVSVHLWSSRRLDAMDGRFDEWLAGGLHGTPLRRVTD